MFSQATLAVPCLRFSDDLKGELENEAYVYRETPAGSIRWT